MEKTLKNTVVKLSREALFILLTVAGAVILPQILHGAGILLGVGGKLGQIFLPMYLPVLILGFYRGPISGAIVGFLAPLVSFAITGMPLEGVLPYITVELIALGLMAGVFSKVKMPKLLRVVAAFAAAKLVRLTVYAVALLLTTGTVAPSALFAGIVLSLPGMAIQIALVTLLLVLREKKA